MYAQGKNRLLYSSNNDGPQDVTVKITNPKLESFGPWAMKFVEGSLYYIDIWFRNLGSYLFCVFEDGTQVYQNILVVSRNAHIYFPDVDKLV